MSLWLVSVTPETFLQICRKRFSFDGAGTVGFLFIPAVWQV